MTTLKKSEVTKEKKLPCGRAVGGGSPKEKHEDPKRFEIWHAELKLYLENNGLKYSEQRWKIAKTILERRGHFNAQEIVQEVLKAHPGIGPATVYRNLKLLCEARIDRRDPFFRLATVRVQNCPMHHDQPPNSSSR